MPSIDFPNTASNNFPDQSPETFPHFTHSSLDGLRLRQTSSRAGQAQLQLDKAPPHRSSSLWRHGKRGQYSLEQHAKVILVVLLRSSTRFASNGRTRDTVVTTLEELKFEIALCVGRQSHVWGIKVG